MSDAPPPASPPPPPTPPPTPPTPPPAPSSTPPPPPPPIDYAMRGPSKPFTIPPYAGCLFKMVLLFAVIIVMGYCALVALNPKARDWALKGGGPTPFKSVNQVLAIPAQAIGKTKDVVAAGDARTNLVNQTVAEEEEKTKRGASVAGGGAPIADPFASAPAAGGKKAAAADKDPDDNRVSREKLLALAAETTDATTPAPVRPKPVATVAPAPPGPPQLKLPGGIVITNASPAGTPAASAPFVYWVAGLSIGGVSSGSPARFLMNGRLVQEGDEVNGQLGIVFDHLDSRAKVIHFRDRNGAVVTRTY